MRAIIKTDQAPAAIGPYSQAVAANGFLFTAGQIALDPQSGQIIGTDVATQTRRVLQNLQAIAEAGGADLNSVMKTTVFLKSMNDFAAMNAVYSEFFRQNPPARSTVEVSRLPKDVLVEIDAVIVLP